jgi:hypothetical protein
MSPRTRTVLLVGGAAVVAVSLLLEIAVPAHHGPGWRDVWFHHVPGFYGVVGFAGCWLLVKVSKTLGKLWLQRPEDHYGEADAEADDPAPEPQGHHHHE